MAESTISWTHYTFNPWRGCERVSPACDNCYAATMSKRNPAVLGEWGPGTIRARAAEPYWKLPAKWNKEAMAAGERRRVFCASLSDVFEDREDLWPDRARLWEVILATPQLDWLLLTKRPQNIAKMLPALCFPNYQGSKWPWPNVWLGTTVETQEWAEERIPHLLNVPAVIHFISAEPLLGPLKLMRWLDGWGDGIDWVIAGGESGGGARPSAPTWFYDLRDQCGETGVAFHFKQWGCHRPWKNAAELANPDIIAIDSLGRVGNAIAESPDVAIAFMLHMNKDVAGRELHGRIWDEVPSPAL